MGIGSVVRVTYGAGAGLGQSQFPGVIQGGPGGGGAGGGSTGEVLSLGEGGEIVVDFGAYDIEDGPGADFIVYENPFLLSPFTPNAEPAQVAVSESGTAAGDFKEFPCDLSRTRGDAGKQEWPYPGCAGVRPVLANVKENCLSSSDPVAGGGDAFDLATVGLKRARYVRLRDAGKAALGTNSRGFDLDAVVLVHPVKR
ncbi:MAG: cell surface protein [Deltaproteobacteria bacterium]|nr:cell surface protein [Deltaproteobacteria bacterium]